MRFEKSQTNMLVTDVVAAESRQAITHFWLGRFVARHARVVLDREKRTEYRRVEEN